MADYPEYDLTLELLACLNVYPNGNSLTAIAKDLRLPDVDAACKVLERIEQKGIGVRRWLADDGTALVAVAEPDWKLAERLATQYVEARDAVNT